MTPEEAAASFEYKYNLKAYFKGLTQPQREFVNDPAKRRAALCSRRAGKTHALLALAILRCLEFPDSHCLYIALTRGSAKKIIWDELKRLNRSLGLGLQFQEVDLTAKFRNGSTFYLNGAETEADIEKFNGVKLRLVGIDECGSFPEHLAKMVREVLRPCLMDLDGEMVLLGTPKDHCRGLFYEVTVGARPGWAVHKWTWRDNPHVPQDWVAREAREEGITEDDPGYQREYCGKWVRSTSRLMYPYDPELNAYEKLPGFASEWHHVVGVDLGWHDETAFAVAGYCADSPILWGMHFEKRPKLSYETIGDDLSRILLGKANYRVCMDTGGLGKTIAMSLQRRLNQKIETAQKTEKMANVAMLRTDLRLGKIKVPRGSPIIAEWDQLLLTEDGQEDPTQPNHLSDAFLYAYRLAKHYWGKTPEKTKSAKEIWTPSNDEMYEKLVAERDRTKQDREDIYGSRIDVNELFR